jgi:hypothetical protein
VLERWDAIEWDFDIILHHDLDEVFATKSWRWFQHRLGGLLAHPHSILHALFTDVEPEAADG